MSEPGEATRILLEMGDDESASERLLPLVYGELRRVAAGYIRQERPDHTLEATALVHEAYFRLVDEKARSFQNRAHFLGVAARAMRQVLVDHARRHQAAKRHGGRLRVTLAEDVVPMEPEGLQMLALDEALTKLSQEDERVGRVVELRYFGGLTIQETSDVLSVSHTTVENDWALARAWLARELAG